MVFLKYIFLSSPLLLRISPKTFAFILILPMCLSSPNRSIHAVFRHFLPCVAPLCKILHYSKTGVPWQMNNTFIIVIVYSFLPGNALFCKGFRGFVKCVCRLASWQNKARWSKLLRAVSSKIGSKTCFLTTKDYTLNRFFSFSIPCFAI